MTDTAASLTYYAMLSLFPLLIALVSLFSLVGDPQTVTDFVGYLADNGADAQTRDAIEAVMRSIVESSSGGASVALVVSLAIALNGASGLFSAAGRALNDVYAVEDDRGFVRKKLQDVAMTLVVIALVMVVIVALFLGGGIVEDVFDLVGLGATAADVWLVARWPIALLAATTAYAVVYAFAPDLQPRRFRWLSPGAIAGVLIWIVASIAFGIYIQNFGNYAAYGTFGAALVLLLWLWVSALAFLFGAELNAELERTESAGRGGPPLVTPPPTAFPTAGAAGSSAGSRPSPAGATGTPRTP
jgi:membrane protein